MLIGHRGLVTTLRVNSLPAIESVCHRRQQLVDRVEICSKRNTVVFPHCQSERSRPGSQRTLSCSVRAPPGPGGTPFTRPTGRVPDTGPSCFRDVFRPIVPDQETTVTSDSGHPRLTSLAITLPSRRDIVVRLHPRLHFTRLITLRHDRFPIHLLLVVLFDVLIYC